MSDAIDTSLTLIDPLRDDAVDVDIFADPGRHFVIRDRGVADALHRAVAGEAPRKQFRVGGGPAATEVEFFVLDLRRDKTLHRGVTQVIDDGFLDAVTRALKTAVGQNDGLLSIEAAIPLEAVREVIELRRFVANAVVLSRSKGRRELLFHHALPVAAE